jgi:hypothetical protein
LDTSQLGLCWHNAMCLLAKLPQCPISQLEIPTTFLGGSSRIAEMVVCHLSCHWGASLRLVKASDAQQNPVRHRNQLDKLIRLTRIWVQIQASPRRQKGRLITSQRLLVTTFWGEAVSLRFREQVRSTVLCENV